MKRVLMISALLVSSTFGVQAVAGERRDAVIGAVLGSGAGALIGHSVSGREGAVLGSAIGAVTGVMLSTSDQREPVRTVVRERVIHEPQRVVVVRQPPRVVVVHHDRHPGKGHGWKRSYAYEDHGRGRDHGHWH